jgi:hypothetical protein
MSTYRVRPGDSLSLIAARLGAAPDAILAANPDKPRALLPSGVAVFASLSTGEDLSLPGSLGIAVLPDQGSCRANGHMAMIPPNLILECVCDDGYEEDPVTKICMPVSAATPPVTPEDTTPPAVVETPPVVEPATEPVRAPIWPWVALGAVGLVAFAGVFVFGDPPAPAPRRRAAHA